MTAPNRTQSKIKAAAQRATAPYRTLISKAFLKEMRDIVHIVLALHPTATRRSRRAS